MNLWSIWFWILVVYCGGVVVTFPMTTRRTAKWAWNRWPSLSATSYDYFMYGWIGFWLAVIWPFLGPLRLIYLSVIAIVKRIVL